MLVHRPAIYEHAAALIGLSPEQAIADAALLARAHRAAIERYRLTHVVPGMDIYGTDSQAWRVGAANAAPRTLRELADTPTALLPAGFQPNVLAAAADLRRTLPAEVQVRVPITGPFSLAAQLLGFDELLMGMLDDPSSAEAAMDRLTDAIAGYIRAVGPTGCGVTIFESAASPPLVRPSVFEQLVLPRLARLVATSPSRPEIVMGGATRPILPMLLTLNPALVVCDPANDPAEFLAACRAAGVALRVNIEPRFRLPEHRIEAHQRLENLARLARGREPLFVATSIIPVDADSQTVLGFTDLVEQVNEAG